MSVVTGAKKRSKFLRECVSMTEQILSFDIMGIQSCQRNKYPMLFIDYVTECVPLKYAKGYKLFSYNEWYFARNRDISPKVWSVVQIEAMAQVFLMTFLCNENDRGKTAVSYKYDKVRFLRRIEPGDRLDIEAICLSYRRGVAVGAVKGFVGGELACSLECTIVVPQDMPMPSKDIRPADPESSLFQAGGNGFGIDKIRECLLFDHPWLLIDRVADIAPGRFARSIKQYTYNEWFFPPHFPDDPSVPGFMQIETCMQGFLMTFLSIDEYKRRETADHSLRNVKVMRKVAPGDTLEINAVLDSLRRGIAKGRVESFVNGEGACSFDVIVAMPSVLDSFKPITV
jgi:3-hydroxyacyl-[acyl-carrier-protein] dehydratase